MNYVRLLTNRISDRELQFGSQCLTPCYLHWWWMCAKSYPANLIMIYTRYRYCNAATEWLQKKKEDDELGSARELKTVRYWTNQGLDFTSCSAWAIDCGSGSSEASAGHCQHKTTCRINIHQRKSCITNVMEVKLKLRQISYYQILKKAMSKENNSSVIWNDRRLFIKRQRGKPIQKRWRKQLQRWNYTVYQMRDGWQRK